MSPIPAEQEDIKLIREPQKDIMVDDLAREDRKNYLSDSKRKRREKNSLHWSFIALIWIASAGVCFVLLAKISHLLLPHGYAWLDDTSLKKLDDFLTSGIIGGTITAFFKSKMSGWDK